MKKKVFLAVLFILIIGSAIAFYIISQPPKEKLSEEFKEKAVTELLGRKAQINPIEEKQGNTKYSGKYISFEYPAKASVYTHKEEGTVKNEESEEFSFDIKSPRIVFNMKSSPYTESVNDSPSVRLREERNYEYKKSQITSGKVKGVSFYKAGMNPEKSGFFVNGGRIFTISVTGVEDKSVAKVFDDIISTISFIQSK